MNRRDFLKGIAGILAASTAPAFVRAQNLMPVRPLPSGLVMPDLGGTLSIYTGTGDLMATMALDEKDFEIVPGLGKPSFDIRSTRELTLDVERTGVAEFFSIKHPLFVGEHRERLQMAGSGAAMTGDRLTFFPQVRLNPD